MVAGDGSEVTGECERVRLGQWCEWTRSAGEGLAVRNVCKGRKGSSVRVSRVRVIEKHGMRATQSEDTK